MASAAKSARFSGRSSEWSWTPNISTTGPSGWTCRFSPRPSARSSGTAMPIKRSEFLGLGFDPLSTDDVVSRLTEVTGAMPYSYVVTPNVDHIVRLHEDENEAARLRTIYEDAALCLCDSKVLHLLGRLRGVRLPVVPGSELTGLMFERVI